MPRKKLNKELNILVADDDAFYLDGVKEFFRKKSWLKQLFLSKNGLEALSIIESQEIDLLIADINMPLMNGIELTDKVRELYPDLKIIIITQFIDREHLFPLFKMEVNSVIDKRTAKKDITKAIMLTLNNENFYSLRIQKIRQDYLAGKKERRQPTDLPKLTKREKQLLPYIAKGYSNKEIAKILENLPEKIIISPATIGTHRQHIYEKFGVHNAAQLANIAHKYGFID